MSSSGFKLASHGRKNLINISRMRAQFNSGISSALSNIGKKNVATAISLIRNGEKTGQVYYRRKGRRRFLHQASAAGEAPANFTGRLIRGMDFKVSGSRFMKFGNRAPYSGFLELGTRKMSKRPYLIKAIEENEGYAFSQLANGPASKMGIK